MRSCARPLTARLGKGSCSRAIRRESLFLFQEISSQSPLLAQSGHADLHRTCPLSGVKRHALPHGKCPLLTQSGHLLAPSECQLDPIRCAVLTLGGRR